MKKQNIGSDFDDFLAEEGMLEEVRGGGKAGDCLANRAGNVGSKVDQDRDGEEDANQSRLPQPLTR